MNPVIIIPAYNSHEEVCHLLEDICPTIPCIIIDNSEISLDFKRPFTNIIRTAPRIGYARAVNLALCTAFNAGYTTAVVCNQDVRLDTTALIHLINMEIKEPTYIHLPIVYKYNSEEIEDYNLVFYGKAFQQDYLEKEIGDKYLLDYVGFVCFSITIEPWMKFGIFDPIYPMYCEDFDFIERWKHSDKKIYLLTCARIHHKGSPQKKPTYHEQYPFVYSDAIYKIRWQKKAPLTTLRKLLVVSIKQSLRGNFYDSVSIVMSILTIIAKWKKIRSIDNLKIMKRIKSQTLKDLAR